MEAQDLAELVAQAALDRKAQNVLVVDVRGQSSYTDFLVIASGTSDRHVQAVTENVIGACRDAGIPSLGSEGLREGQWALADFGGVVLHVFHPFTRELYNLEGMWKDAPKRWAESTPAGAQAGPGASAQQVPASPV